MDSESKGVTAFKACQLLPNPYSPLAHSLAPLRVSCTWGWEPWLDCLCLSLLSRRPQGHRRQLSYESPKFWLPGASAGARSLGDPEAPTSERCISARAGDEQIPLAERGWEGGPTEAQPLPPPPRTDEASLEEPDSGPEAGAISRWGGRGASLALPDGKQALSVSSPGHRVLGCRYELL